MALSRGLRALTGVLGYMRDAAAAAGRSTQNMWQAYTDAYARQGIERPPATLQDMNTFRQWLGTNLRASTALGRASDTDALTAEHITTPLGYSPNPVDQAAPSMLVTFQAFVDTPNGPVERWSAAAYNMVLPSTVGELKGDLGSTLQTQMDLAAMEEGEDSPTAGGTVLGLGQIYVTARGL